MQITGNTAINLVTGQQKPLSEFAASNCDALAGIGNPDRFFKLLESAGLNCKAHSFPDHYKFQLDDISFAGSGPVLMTEKDAVKCMTFAESRHWYVPIAAIPESGFAERLLALLATVKANG
jgi:tetraacyldisaccharide 4'-kinase